MRNEVLVNFFMKLKRTCWVRVWGEVKPRLHRWQLSTEVFRRCDVLYNAKTRWPFRGLLIAQLEHELTHWDIHEILPIGVIRCAAAKASPIENLPWVTFLPNGGLKKANWCNVHAQCCGLIKAGGIRSHKLHKRCPLIEAVSLNDTCFLVSSSIMILSCLLYF